MKRVIISIVVLAQIVAFASLVWLISGQVKAQTTYQTPLETVQKAALAQVDINKMKEADALLIKRLYRLNPKDFEGAVLFSPQSNMECEELFIVKLKSLDQQKAVEEAIKARLATQKKNFDGYGTYQSEMLKHARLEVKGNYVIFVVAKHPGSVMQAVQRTLK